MLDLSVKIEAKYFKSFMQDLKVKVSNLSPAFQEYAQYIKRETEGQFRDEKTASGQKWAALRPATLKRKKTSYILRETFEMYRSFFTEVSPKQLRYGLRDPKAKYHEFGTSRMVARPIISNSDTQERRGELNKIIVRYLRVKRAGRR